MFYDTLRLKGNEQLLSIETLLHSYQYSNLQTRDTETWYKEDLGHFLFLSTFDKK